MARTIWKHKTTGQQIVMAEGRRATSWGWELVGDAPPTPIEKAKAQYAPGGGFGKGVEAGLERGRVKAMASGMQGLVSAGLAGTTMAGTLGKKYEEEVAAPTRLSVEERRAQAISGIEMQQAGMGFQAGQAGAQRDLQKYIADLQATLQREQMAPRGPTVSMATPTTPTGGGYAKQFPSIYGQEAQVPDWTGGGGGSAPSGTPQALWQTGQWGQSLASERERAGPEGLYGTKYEWA